MAGFPGGLAAAYRDALHGGRLAWASPAVITVGAYLGFYGLGLILSGASSRLPAMALAVSLGLFGLLAGVGLAWKGAQGPTRRNPVDRSLLTLYGLLLLWIGLVALVAYFVRIGYIPLLQPGLEQARIEAATEGGAPLRVLSLLALPGAWILIAVTVAARNWLGIATAVVAVVLVALGFTLTGNRSPAFTLVEVGLFTGLLASGMDRLGARGLATLAFSGIILVGGAGVFGAFRLASRDNFIGPPTPGTPPPNYPALTVIAIRGYLVVPVQNLNFTMDAVPGLIDWRLGATYLQPLLTVLPGKQTTFDADLKTVLKQRYAGGGTVPGLLGEAYANFGVIGWFAIPFLAGAALTALYRVCRGGAPELAALYGFALAHVSIGGVVSGLAVASVFPYVAYAVLGFAVVGLPIVGRRAALGRHTGSA